MDGVLFQLSLVDEIQLALLPLLPFPSTQILPFMSQPVPASNEVFLLSLPLVVSHPGRSSEPTLFVNRLKSPVEPPFSRTYLAHFSYPLSPSDFGPDCLS